MQGYHAAEDCSDPGERANDPPLLALSLSLSTPATQPDLNESPTMQNDGRHLPAGRTVPLTTAPTARLPTDPTRCPMLWCIDRWTWDGPRGLPSSRGGRAPRHARDDAAASRCGAPFFSWRPRLTRSPLNAGPGPAPQARAHGPWDEGGAKASRGYGGVVAG